MTTTDLFLHPYTRKTLQALAQKASHATMLYGEPGVGTYAAAQWLAQQMNAPHVTTLAPDEKGTITIEAIRDLYQQTRSKQAKRVVIIDDADSITHAAQNAFLKLLEEPGEAISFILTTHNRQNILQTIRSRTQALRILPISSEQMKQMLAAHKVTDPARHTQIQFIASGKPAEIARLVQNDEYFSQQVQFITDAKQFLQGTPYQKLLTIQAYSSDRHKALRLLAAASTILRFTLQKDAPAALIAQLEKILEAQRSIHENGHVKTHLLRVIMV